MGAEQLFLNGLLWQWVEGEGSFTGAGVKGRAELGWFVVKEGRFKTVGLGKPPSGLMEEGQEVVDLGGRLVLPGLIDAHIHVGYMGQCATYAQLSGCKSISELQSCLRAHCHQQEDGSEGGRRSWVVGVGWDQSTWGRYPTRQDLDEVEASRPMVLYRTCWHIVVANSEALRRAGLKLQAGEAPPHVEGGCIDVDPSTGIPTGILREAASPLVTSLIAETDPEVRTRYFTQALERCLASGLTAVQTNDDKGAWHIYRQLQDQGDLHLRIFLTINHPEMEEVLATTDSTTSEGRDSNSGHHHHPLGPLSGARHGPLLSCHRVKLYSDGSLGAETAALRRPYVGTDNVGVLIHKPEELRAKVASAHAAGYQLEVHAIGDRAVEVVLSSLEGVTGGTLHRPIITHCQVLGTDLMERMSRLGVVANIQPSFVGTDSAWVRQRLPPEVQDTSYCWKTLMSAGVHCAGGSDAPIEDCDPLLGMYDAMRRLPHSFKNKNKAKSSQGKKTTADNQREEEEEAAATFLPHERLSFAEALWLYTIGAAYACKSEGELGQIREGFLADFVVLSLGNNKGEEGDMSAGPTADMLLLPGTVVEEVWVNGVRRHGRDGGGGGGSIISTVGGPYVPGKNGPVGFLARRVWHHHHQQHQDSSTSSGGSSSSRDNSGRNLNGMDGLRSVHCCCPHGRSGGCGGGGGDD